MSQEVYTKRAIASLKKETEVGTPVVPTTFFRFNEEDITVEYGLSPLSPVAGNRSLFRGGVDAPIPSPSGKIEINVEPKTVGHFLANLLGGFTYTGNYMPLTSKSGAFTVGETVTGGTSAKTATVVADGKDFIIVSSPSGDFTDGETVTGATSAKTGVLTAFDSTVYAHYSTLPAEMSTSYTLQINYPDHAIRYYGTRFNKIDALGQKDNIVTMGLGIRALGAFRMAKVTAITASGAGAKAISVDDCTGIIATDSIKLYRPSTGLFLDFSAASVKTHTIGSVTGTTVINVTNLETATAVGDLILLAPQTATYTLAKEMPFIGGASIQLGSAIASVATEAVKEVSVVVESELEDVHTANGTGLAKMFPSTMYQKGLKITGNVSKFFTDEEYMAYLRDNTSLALRCKFQGATIGSTTLRYELRIDLPEIYLGKYATPIKGGEIVSEDIPFEAAYNSTDGWEASVLLVNDMVGTTYSA